jgi:hypothetical protein
MKQMIAKAKTPPTSELGRLLTPAECADRLGVPIGTLVDWRYRRVGPPLIKLGKLCRYSEVLLERWIAERLQQGAA